MPKCTISASEQAVKDPASDQVQLGYCQATKRETVTQKQARGRAGP